MNYKLNNHTYLKSIRKYLRNHSTEAERVLWDMLKNSKFEGRKFRRQHGIGKYIVDFYCVSEKLAIELDGQPHYTPEGIAKDQEKDNHLKEMNIKVLRFENKEVLNNLTQVLKIIKTNFKTLPR